jgi:malonyl-CoA O-methyltransferase
VSIVASTPEVSADEHPMQVAPRSARVSVSEGYERWASTYDQTPNPLLALERRCVPPLLPPLEGKCALDVACGTGRWCEILAARGAGRTLGADFSAAMLVQAAQKPAARGALVQADACCLPFAKQHFDFVICSFAASHIPRLDSLAAECARVLKPNADLFLTDVHPEAYATGWRTGFRDRNVALEITTISRSCGEIVQGFSRSGFQCKGLAHFSFGRPEKAIFLRAGKSDEFFERASSVPAILVCRFRRRARDRRTHSD